MKLGAWCMVPALVCSACGGATVAAPEPRPCPEAAPVTITRVAPRLCTDLRDYELGREALRAERGDAILLYYGTGARHDEELVRTLTKAAPGVQVAPFVIFEGMIVGPQRVMGMPVQGRSPGPLRALSRYVTAGDLATLEAGTVALGRELADVLGARVGDEIGVAPLLPVQGEVAENLAKRPGQLRRLRVVTLLGFPANGINALDHDELVVPLAEAQNMWTESGATADEIGGYHLHFADPAAAADGIRAIRAVLPQVWRLVELAELERGGEMTIDLVRRWCQ